MMLRPRGSALGRRAMLGAALVPLAAPALAAFPDRPVRIVVPWPPGALLDVVVRVLAQAASGPLGQAVVVENRAGATGAVGAELVARAPADGHTLVAANAETHAINPLIYRRLPYNAETDFTPVSMIARAPFALVAGPSLPVNDVAGFIAAARARPGQVSYASWGAGSTSRLCMELLIKSQGLNLLHVPFTGQAPAITAVTAGQVDVMFLTAGGGEAAARGNGVKLLAVSSAQRVPLMPQAPTLRELGIAVEGGNWFGLMGPGRMPAEVARRLSEVTAEAMRTEVVQQVYRAQAAEPLATTPEEMGRFIARDRAAWAELVRAMDLQLD